MSDAVANQEEHSFFVARLPEKPEVAIAFPLTGPSLPCAAVSATLPLTTLPGLKTPLNAPFQLTANRDLALSLWDFESGVFCVVLWRLLDWQNFQCYFVKQAAAFGQLVDFNNFYPCLKCK